jgi:prepilin-type N-terminal cleavage/methylation domain-containing protein
MEPARGGTHFRHPMKKAGHFILFKSNSFRNGFTLIETIIVLGVLVVISVVMISSLFSRRSRTDLDNTTRQIAALFREAQSRSMSQEGGAAWGVHIENSTATQSFYALFKGIYSSSTIVGYYKIPSNVQLASSSIPLGNSLEIIFSQVSGIPSTPTSIGLNLTTGGGGGGSSQASVGRTSSGKVFFDDFNRSSL